MIGYHLSEIMKACVVITVIIICFVFAIPQNSFAATHVTVYFAGGVVIGGVSIFFSVFFGGHGHSSKNEKNDEDRENSSAVLQAFNCQPKNITEEDVKQAGLVKVLEW